MSIPKIIHYCWVGGKPKPQSVLHCIESWKRCCPDYEIKEWNESNYDFTRNEYMRQAYKSEKWGFVPDYARLDIVYQCGGIYLDTDVELVQNLDVLLHYSSFFGFEDTGEGKYYIACGLGFGAEQHNPLIKSLRDYYDDILFIHKDGSLNLTPAPRHNVTVFENYGVSMNNLFQEINRNAFFPSEYFCPKIFMTGETRVTDKTLSIHHFSASWMDPKIREEISHNQAVCLRWGNKLGGKILWLESAWAKYGAVCGIKLLLIQAYESCYRWTPLALGTIERIGNMGYKKGIAIFDTGVCTLNMGDHIIVDCCEKELQGLLDMDNVPHISTHIIPNKVELKQIRYKRKLLYGTNILSCDMETYGLWKLPRQLYACCNTTLMGVGFDSFNARPSLYSKALLKFLLSKDSVHSVRDSFSANMLHEMGFTNVINTGCPTMWNLTPEHCAMIPVEKAQNVICTLTDYCRDEENDSAMLHILKKNYKIIYFWLQGQGDLDYIRSLGFENDVTFIQPSLKAFDAVLQLPDMDYVGTRLHAGIRAMNKCHRSLIISIDNRAECIHKDTGLPIIYRKEIPEKLQNRITGTIYTRISMPWDNIAKWKAQFRKW